MNLIIDSGNTCIKYYLFVSNKIIKEGMINENEQMVSFFKKLKKVYAVKSFLYADVRGIDFSFLKYIFDKCFFVQLEQAKYPFKVLYKTSTTLGQDRIGLMAAASLCYPNSNVFVIDMGSCITYDFLDKKKQYRGGAISPGFKMRYKSLASFTSKLPLLNFKTPKTYIGSDTESSIHSGVFYGILSEIETQIMLYSKKFSDLKIILTGGDKNKLFKRIKFPIFAPSNFLARGLNYIVEINKP